MIPGSGVHIPEDGIRIPRFAILEFESAKKFLRMCEMDMSSEDLPEIFLFMNAILILLIFPVESLLP